MAADTISRSCSALPAWQQDYTGVSSEGCQGTHVSCSHQPQKGQAVSNHSCRVFPKIAVHLCTVGVGFCHISLRCGTWKATALLVFSSLWLVFVYKACARAGYRVWLLAVQSDAEFWLQAVQSLISCTLFQARRKSYSKNFCQSYLWNSLPSLKMKYSLLRLFKSDSMKHNLKTWKMK